MMNVQTTKLQTWEDFRKFPRKFRN